MNTELLQSLVEEDFGYEKSGKDWGRSEEHSSLVVDERNQRWYWNSKDMGGDVEHYLILVRGLSKKAAEEILRAKGQIVGNSVLEDEDGIAVNPMEKLVDCLWELGKRNREYWYSRKLKDSTIDRYRLGFYNGWSLLPLYVNNKFVNFQCRRDFPKKLIRYWYKIPNFKPIIINSDILNLVDSIFITEGPVDSILLNQEGIPSISHTGGSGYWSDDWYPLFNRVKKIYYVADNDAPGRHAAVRVANSLGLYRTHIYLFGDEKPDKYDTGDYFKEGGNSKDFREMVIAGSRNLFELEELNGRKTKINYKVFRGFHQANTSR